MKKSTVRTQMPTRDPIAVYRKSRTPIVIIIVAIIFLIALNVLMTTPDNWISGNVLVFLIGLFIFNGIRLTWNILRTKVERYQDAVVIYSGSLHKVFYFTDIANFSSEYVELPRGRGFNYTQYTLERSDGVTMSFSDTLQSAEELVKILEKEVGESKDAVSEAIDKLKRGEKIVFSQFTVTAQGITAENGEFRAWSDINIGQEGNNRRLVFRERNKPAVMGGQAVWAPLPKQNTSMLEKLLYHFQAND